MQRTFDVITDPGHGWARVPFTVLSAIGMGCEDFSSYSYLFYSSRKGKFAEFILLEEDCDLMKFAKRYEEVTGNAPKWREHYSDKAALRTSRRYFRNTPEHREHVLRYA